LRGPVYIQDNQQNSQNSNTRVTAGQHTLLGTTTVTNVSSYVYNYSSTNLQMLHFHFLKTKIALLIAFSTSAKMIKHFQ